MIGEKRREEAKGEEKRTRGGKGRERKSTSERSPSFKFATTPLLLVP